MTIRQQMKDRADYKIGWWLSAALEDPNVCAEMKADIHAWFEAHQPGLISDAATLTPAACEHAAIISLDGKWHCQKCGDAIEMATALSPAERPGTGNKGERQP